MVTCGDRNDQITQGYQCGIQMVKTLENGSDLSEVWGYKYGDVKYLSLILPLDPIDAEFPHILNYTFGGDITS